MNISKKEFFIVLALAISVWLLSILPIIYGYRIANADQIFIGYKHFWPEETAWQLNWAKQVERGHIFGELKYYSSDVKTELIFNPVSIALGLTSRLTGIPLVYIFHFFRLFFAIFLLLMIYSFVSLFFKEIIWRQYTLVFIIVSSGLYWLTLTFNKPIITDCWDVESSVFATISVESILPFALSLMLWIFIYSFKYYNFLNIRHSFYSGLIALLLGMIHHFTLILTYIILGFTIILLLFYFIIKDLRKNILFLKNIIINYSIIIIISMPIMFIYLYVTISDPLIQNYLMINDNFTIPIIISDYGFELILALIGIIVLLINREKNFYFPILWLIICLSLILIPVPYYNIKMFLLEGLSIPIGILAVRIISKYISPKLNDARYFSLNNLPRLFLLIVFLAFFSLTNIFLYSNHFKELSKKQFPDFINKDTFIALKWLQDNSQSQDFILSSMKIHQLIPYLTGNRSYSYLDDSEFIAIERKRKIEWFFDENIIKTSNEMLSFLKINKIDYIFWGPFESLDQKSNIEQKILLLPNLSKVLSNNYVDIFKFIK